MCSIFKILLTRGFFATSAVTLAVAAMPAHALLLDFEDITPFPTTTYAVGTNFNTGGFNVDVQEFFFGDGTGCSSVPACGEASARDIATYSGGVAMIGSGQGLVPSNTLLDFGLGIINQLSLEWHDFGGNSNLRVNGTLFNVGDFLLLNGMSVGAVTISVTDLSSGATDPYGTLSLSGGAINDFAIGGQELIIDNLRTPMPEPATLALLGVGVAGISYRRRKQIKAA